MVSKPVYGSFGYETPADAVTFNAMFAPDVVPAPPADVYIKSSETGTKFTDGSILSGSWVTEYSPSGTILAILNFDMTVTGPSGTTHFTSAAAHGPVGASPNYGPYEIYSAGTGPYTNLYMDWSTETPADLLRLGTMGRYTSVSVPGHSGGVSLVSNGTPITNTVVCFVAGTMVSTPAGQVAIESLNAGDLVTLSNGGSAPIRWMGRKAVATRFADRLRAMPIRIRAGALDDQLPARDLLVSPCHALLIDGALVQAGALVNGSTIVREMAMPEIFAYYHIELADHALILAEGVPAETFVDNIDRLTFDNWAEHEALAGSDVEIVEMAYPRAKSARQVPAVTRARLAARIGEMAIAA